jgi:hypothetical protein
MLDIIFSKKNIKPALRFTFFICLVCEELRTMIGDDFPDFSNLAIIIKRLSDQVDARNSCCCCKFSTRKNKSRTIVEDRTDFFAIDPAGMPIKMNRSKAVLSFISYPGFPTSLLFLVLTG